MKKLCKNTNDVMVFGVCSGLAKYTGLDVSVIRILTVLGALFSFSGIFWIYLLLGIILPSDHE